MTPTLDVRDLRTELHTPEGVATVVNGVSFSIDAGQTMAIVGESGCGKTMTALSLLRIHPEPPARIAGGEVRLMGRDLLPLSEREMRQVRGNEISMIFQEPMTSLNPVLTVSDQITEAILQHRNEPRRRAREEALELLRMVNIPDPEHRLNEYPHRLSGGMRQRVMIAMALACRPNLLVADEPTTALDVTIQVQILSLIKRLQTELGTAVILITHDLGLVAEYAERVVVMYAGRVVEEATTEALFNRPLHPYTRGLLAATPRFTNDVPVERGRLVEISGVVPPLHSLPRGCAFAPRCRDAIDRCRTAVPPLSQLPAGRGVACIVAANGAAAP